MQSISIKDLRQNLSKVADASSAGQEFTVFRRSKPAFKIVPIDSNETNSDENWVDFIDFTEGGKTEGMLAEDVIELLESI